MIKGVLKRLPEIIAHVTAPSHYLYEGSKGEYKAHRNPGDNSLWDLLADLSRSWAVLDKHSRHILYLYYLEGLTDEVIGHELGVERSTITRARAQGVADICSFLETNRRPINRAVRGISKLRKNPVPTHKVKTLVEFYEYEF